MEITVLCLLWGTCALLTFLSFYVKNNHVLPALSGIGWIAFAMSLGEITYISPNSVGATYVDINMGNAHTVGLIGAYWFFWTIGLALILFTAAWFMMGRNTNEEV